MNKKIVYLGISSIFVFLGKINAINLEFKNISDKVGVKFRWSSSSYGSYGSVGDDFILSPGESKIKKSIKNLGEFFNETLPINYIGYKREDSLVKGPQALKYTTLDAYDLDSFIIKYANLNGTLQILFKAGKFYGMEKPQVTYIRAEGESIVPQLPKSLR